MAENKGTNLRTALWQRVSDKEYSNILYYLTSLYGWDSDDYVTDENRKRFETDIRQARGVIRHEKEHVLDDDESYDDDDEASGEVSFYCSNDEGEGMVTFKKNGAHWKEHWSEWKPYDDDDYSTPAPLSYMSYLDKDDLKNYLSHDGFRDITEVTD